ncbi:MAG: response regulator transcription factor [Defluviitaleaceae bacterium]|nr:response regulator transcription factor [Defluviitaleaceae bacterium]MCL2239205.1 response regulator transcription factor [Defluviitaleaceae bacterium]MCL2240314.1 response regulator transcription factor [Defluviitaleaceae bacterium]
MTKRVYIADDEANIRSLIKAFLVKAGYDVTDFENGDALLSAFVDEPADLVVLDVMMPGSNGFVICKELRKKSTVPIIMLTARDSDLDYATGLDLGSDDYLIKPFSPMALVKRVQSILRRIDIEREAAKQPDNLLSFISIMSNEMKIPMGAIVDIANNGQCAKHMFLHLTFQSG